MFTIIFRWFLNSWKAWRTSSNAPCSSLNVLSMSRRSSWIQDCFCSGRPGGSSSSTNVSVAYQPNFMKGRTFPFNNFRLYPTETVRGGYWVLTISVSNFAFHPVWVSLHPDFTGSEVNNIWYIWTWIVIKQFFCITQLVLLGF